MNKTEALIFLINSLSKTEKKAFNLATQNSKTSNYVKLYTIIVKDKNVLADPLRKKYVKLIKGSSFETSVNHLYRILLNAMLELRKDQDSHYSLFDKILKARILFEKSMYNECFDLLDKVKNAAREQENFYALLLASRLELEYLLTLNFPEIDEKVLLHKHFKVNETLRITQKIQQQSALYELLRHRMIYKGNARSEQQKNELNDLVVSEMSIVASSNIDNFEIDKLHQLFQANYLISVGDYKSALHSFYELNSLLESKKRLWADPPIFYVLTLEGILDSLRSLGMYDGMDKFIQQLKKINSRSQSFNANVTCIVFLYELFPFLDTGDFEACQQLMKKYQEDLLKKPQLLSLSRNAELSLYLALINFGHRDFRKAQKLLTKIIFTSRSYAYLPLYRTIRLVNLMILYELKDFDLIKNETRSIKREMKNDEKGYKIEKRILNFVNKQSLPISVMKRNLLWDHIKEEFTILHQDVYELQTLKLFDFSAWIESKIRRVPLTTILVNRNSLATNTNLVARNSL